MEAVFEKLLSLEERLKQRKNLSFELLGTFRSLAQVSLLVWAISHVIKGEIIIKDDFWHHM